MTGAAYDFTADFDYAKQEDRAGILLGVALLATDSAAGMLNYGWGAYAVEEAKKARVAGRRPSLGQRGLRTDLVAQPLS